MNKRLAIMRASVELIESILPPGKVLDCVADKIGPVEYDWLHKALLLPDDCRITGVSAALYFGRNQVAIRVESPEFVQTMEGCAAPEVESVYRAVQLTPDQSDSSGVTLGEHRLYFTHWEGLAVEFPAKMKEMERAAFLRMNGPGPHDGFSEVPTDESASWRDCPPML